MDVTCPCGTVFVAKHPRARYHSDRCRKRAQRTPGAAVVELPVGKADASVADAPAEVGPVEAATRRELDAAKKLESSIGQSCLVLARRLDAASSDTASALSTAAGRLDDLMAKALRGTGAASAPQQLRDELATRRARHA